MSNPIVFISTHKIKEGKLDAFKERNKEVASFLKENKPGTVAFLTYLNENETEVSLVHIFPDAESMELHMQGVGERAKDSNELLEFRRHEVYGKPRDKVLQMMKQASGPGVTVSVRPENIGGYIRPESG